MKKILFYKGLPASGKSTHSRKLIDNNPGKYKRINKDDLRGMLDNNKYSSSNEKFVLQMRDAIILAALEAGKHVIVDDTNIHPRHEQRIRQLAKGQAVVELVDFMHVSVETCIERDLKRSNSVGAKVIRRMWHEYVGHLAPVLVQDAGLPHAIICDLDGTLALLNGRSPYDASKCDMDKLNVPVAEILNRFHATGHQILFLTGREDKFEAPTLRFLAKHLGPDFKYELFMRKTDDRRKDSIIKQELLEGKVLPRFHVDFVLDDRNQVVDMWRSLGLTCLQVNYGDF
ncbi:MAG TPA: polynucleotide kinase [Bacteroidetes bacterium]|nr:polynucleotide kinase [Bacteroidota bacterium]